jgi:hypothetical protein
MRTCSLRRFVVASIAAVLCAPCAAPLIAHQLTPDENLVIGTWRLNVSRSRYIPGPAPQSETRTYEVDGTMTKATITRAFVDGRKEIVRYTANYDNPYPVTGSADIDRILMKRLDAYRSDSVLSHAGRVFGIARRVVAPDGRSMTITFRREGEELVNNVAYYERESQ